MQINIKDICKVLLCLIYTQTRTLMHRVNPLEPYVAPLMPLLLANLKTVPADTYDNQAKVCVCVCVCVCEYFCVYMPGLQRIPARRRVTAIACERAFSFGCKMGEKLEGTTTTLTLGVFIAQCLFISLCHTKACLGLDSVPPHCTF